MGVWTLGCFSLSSCDPHLPSPMALSLVQMFLFCIRPAGLQLRRGCSHCWTPGTYRSRGVIQETSVVWFVSSSLLLHMAQLVPCSRLCVCTHPWPGFPCWDFSSPQPLSCLTSSVLASSATACFHLVPGAHNEAGALNPECGSRFQ